MLWFFSIFFSIEATVSSSIGLAAVGFLFWFIWMSHCMQQLRKSNFQIAWHIIIIEPRRLCTDKAFLLYLLLFLLFLLCYQIWTHILWQLLCSGRGSDCWSFLNYVTCIGCRAELCTWQKVLQPSTMGRYPVHRHILPDGCRSDLWAYIHV